MKRIIYILYFTLGSLLTVVAAFTVGTLLASSDHPVPEQQPEPPLIVIPTSDSQAVSVIRIDPAPLPEADLSAYNIVYLTGEGLNDVQLSPENVFGSTANVQTAQSMTDVETFAATHSIDALVIHASAAVDSAWTADLVRQGVVMVSIDVSLSQNAEWLDSDCLQQMAANPNQVELEITSAHFAYSQMVTVAAENVTDIPLVADHILDKECLLANGGRPQVSGLYFSRSSFTKIALDDNEGMMNLRHSISDHLRRRQETLYNFANRHSPTPFPPINVPGS